MDEQVMIKQIGQKIRKIRVAKGMTQNDLAFAAHISSANVSDIELGKTNIRITTFVRIVEALQISADELLPADTKSVNKIYSNEFSNLLSDCTPDEKQAIIEIVRQIKKAFHSNKEKSDS